MDHERALRGTAALRRSSRAPLSNRQVNSLIALGVAILGVVFGLQSIPLLSAHLDQLRPLWLLSFGVVFTASLGAALVSALFGRFARVTHGIVAVTVLAGIVTWPLGIASSEHETDPIHWLSFYLVAAVASAAVAFPRALAAAYLVVVPTTYAALRIVLDSDGLHWARALLDSAFSLVLGAVVLVIISMLRAASIAVDVAQEAALERYADAVRQHATEVERVRVDAIVHDSVLTTLLSAARASTAEEKSLASLMASNAIGYLQQAALVVPGETIRVPVSTVASRIETAVQAFDQSIEVRTRSIESSSLPSSVAEVLFSAAMQALVNSVQHAGSGPSVARWLVVRGLSPQGLEIEVGDTGAGFVPDEVAQERLGLRVSIIERVSQAGGEVEIDSSPGDGTVVTVRWRSSRDGGER